MLGMFNSVKPYVVPKPKVDVPRPDNAVFRLHYKASLNCAADHLSISHRKSYFCKIHEENSSRKVLFTQGTGRNDWWNLVQ